MSEANYQQIRINRAIMIAIAIVMFVVGLVAGGGDKIFAGGSHNQDDKCYEDVITYKDIIEKEVSGIIIPGGEGFDWVDWPGAGSLIDDGRSRSGNHNSILKTVRGDDGVKYTYKTKKFRYVVVGQHEIINQEEVPCPPPSTTTTEPPETTIPPTTVAPTTTAPATTSTVPDTTVPDTTVPVTTIPETTTPETTVPETTIPETSSTVPVTEPPLPPTTDAPPTTEEDPVTEPECTGICGPATVVTDPEPECTGICGPATVETDPPVVTEVPEVPQTPATPVVAETPETPEVPATLDPVLPATGSPAQNISLVAAFVLLAGIMFFGLAAAARR